MVGTPPLLYFKVIRSKTNGSAQPKPLAKGANERASEPEVFHIYPTM